MPSAAHIPMPWIMAYDTKPLDTLKDRERFYEEALANDYILFLEHDLYNEACRLKDTPKGARVAEKGRLVEFFRSLVGSCESGVLSRESGYF